MNETMGQIIKRLRRDRGMTQDELAENLGVTFQAVSKWETDAGMPDISQIVPLAAVFSVSTDVLFGLNGTGSEEEVRKIIEEAHAFLTYPVTQEQVKKKYRILHEGLKKYPGSCALLMQCLETGITLAYPTNDLYDAENGCEIYRKCVSEADQVIRHSRNVTDVLRAHMIMVLLHAAYGNFDAARLHAKEFPWRSDMTVHEMRGYIARWEKKPGEESRCWQTDFMYHFEAMLDDMTDIAMCACRSGNYSEAAECLRQTLDLIALVCRKEDTVPRFHVREAGDLHFLLAGVYLKQGQTENALAELRKMTDYDTAETAKFIYGRKMNSPFLHDADFNFFWNDCNFRACLLSKLNDASFDGIRDTEEFREILRTAES